jgi:hypothetical protein
MAKLVPYNREGSEKKFVTLTLLVVVVKKKISQNFKESLTELFKIKQRNLLRIWWWWRFFRSTDHKIFNFFYKSN